MREVILDLGNDLECFVKEQLENGNYTSANELIIDALTKLENKISLEISDNAIFEVENNSESPLFDK